MAQWYYAEGPARNVGPLSTQQLSDLFRRGQILLDTPVWREGMAQWQPLRHVTGELGIEGMSSGSRPPPLPSQPPPIPAFRPHSASAQTVTASEPRTLSRGMIALIICAALALPLLAILGILAAIALPAYQDYTLRAKAAEAIAAGQALKDPIEQYLNEHDQCPANGGGDFGTAESYAGRFVETITVGEFDDGTCGVEVRVRGTDHRQLDGHAIWISFDRAARRWDCTSEIDDRYLPAHCRG